MLFLSSISSSGLWGKKFTLPVTEESPHVVEESYSCLLYLISFMLSIYSFLIVIVSWFPTFAFQPQRLRQIFRNLEIHRNQRARLSNQGNRHMVLITGMLKTNEVTARQLLINCNWTRDSCWKTPVSMSHSNTNFKWQFESFKAYSTFHIEY